MIEKLFFENSLNFSCEVDRSTRLIKVFFVNITKHYAISYDQGTITISTLAAFPVSLTMILAIAFIYACLILFYSIGWFCSPRVVSERKSNLNTRVTVIVPFRNESENIQHLALCLVNQNYPRNLVNIIYVDDYSEDDSLFKLKQILEKHSDFRQSVLELKSCDFLSGKKSAIYQAVLRSDSDLIVTTDADCVMEPEWLSTIVSFYECENPKFIIGPVKLNANHSYFQKAQEVEFNSLIATGAASLYYNLPLMCNGANLAYPRNVYLSVFNQIGGDKLASGDDMFLMLAIKREFGSSAIKFLKSTHAMVFTKPQSTLRTFVAQRVRWASKGLHYNDTWLYLNSLIVTGITFLMLVLAVLALLKSEFVFQFIALVAIKTGIDFLFLFLCSGFFQNRRLVWYVIPLQFLYFIYVPFVIVKGLFGKTYWKNRDISVRSRRT